MSPEYSLCPQSIVYVLRVQFMSPEYRLCPQSTVYDHRVRYISSDCSESPYIIVFLQEDSIFLQSAVYVFRVQFMS